MDFVGDVGEVFVVDWAFSVGWASSRGEIQYWPSNYIGVGDIGTWDCEGFVRNLSMWVLWSRHGRLPPFSLLHLFQSSYCQNLLKQHNQIFPSLGSFTRKYQIHKT